MWMGIPKWRKRTISKRDWNSSRIKWSLIFSNRSTMIHILSTNTLNCMVYVKTIVTGVWCGNCCVSRYYGSVQCGEQPSTQNIIVTEAMCLDKNCRHCNFSGCEAYHGCWSIQSASVWKIIEMFAEPWKKGLWWMTALWWMNWMGTGSVACPSLGKYSEGKNRTRRWVMISVDQF